MDARRWHAEDTLSGTFLALREGSRLAAVPGNSTDAAYFWMGERRSEVAKRNAEGMAEYLNALERVALTGGKVEDEIAEFGQVVSSEIYDAFQRALERLRELRGQGSEVNYDPGIIELMTDMVQALKEQNAPLADYEFVMPPGHYRKFLIAFKEYMGEPANPEDYARQIPDGPTDVKFMGIPMRVDYSHPPDIISLMLAEQS